MNNIEVLRILEECIKVTSENKKDYDDLKRELEVLGEEFKKWKKQK